MAFSDSFPTFAKLFRRFFGGAPEEVSDEPKYWDESVKLTLAKLVQSQASLSLGSVQVFSLGQFRAEIGAALWKKHREKILIIVETTLQKRIGRGNTVIPQGKDTWLLVMPELPQDEAEARADGLAQLIGQKLVGLNFTSQELPLPQTAKLNLNGALNDDGSLNVLAIQSAVAKSRTEAQKRPAARVGQKEKYKPSLKSGTKKESQTTDKKEKIELPPPDDMGIMFLPIWSDKTQSIDTFSAQFALTEPPQGDALSVSDSDQVASNCLGATELVLRSLKRLTTAKIRCVIAMPIPWAVAKKPALRDELLKRMSVMPEAQRLLYVRYDILNVPASADVQEITSTTQAFVSSGCRDICVQVPWEDQHEQMGQLPRTVIKTDMSEAERTSNYSFGIQIEFFVNGSETNLTCITGLKTRGEVSLALKSGASQVGGSGLLEPVPQPPSKVVTIPREKLEIKTAG